MVIAAILTAAMGFQYLNAEIPCPLCLLQRVAMFGVCFGIIRNFRGGYSDRNAGWSMLFSLLLLIVSVRQTLLNIYPRPGHAYIGSAVFGIHMPVWCVLIATAILIAFGLKLTILGGDGRRAGRKPTGALGRLATIGSIYVHRTVRHQFRFGGRAMRGRCLPHLRIPAAEIRKTPHPR